MEANINEVLTRTYLPANLTNSKIKTKRTVKIPTATRKIMASLQNSHKTKMIYSLRLTTPISVTAATLPKQFLMTSQIEN